MSKRETCAYAEGNRVHPLFGHDRQYDDSLCVYPVPAWLPKAFDHWTKNRVGNNDCERCPCWKEKETTNGNV